MRQKYAPGSTAAYRELSGGSGKKFSFDPKQTSNLSSPVIRLLVVIRIIFGKHNRIFTMP
jgi:hypothetical protein